MESQIFECVDNDDVEGLKLLTNYPNFFEIEDDYGCSILQKAIWDNKIAVFDFLLSLDGCPINAPNSRGKTALEIAHHIIYSKRREAEHFVYSLLKKGADINCYHEKTKLLCIAVHYNQIKVAKFLIENGSADLSCYIDSFNQTLLHEVLLSGRDGKDRNELLAMMLCFGADPSIPDEYGRKPIDFAFKEGNLSESMREQLVFYFFDDYSTDYEIPLDSLFYLLESDSPLAPQVIKYITSVKVNECVFIMDLEFLFHKLFTIKPAYLKLLLEKFEHVVDVLLNDRIESGIISWAVAEETFTQNFDLLLQSQFSSDVIQVINSKFRISTLFAQLQYRTIPRSEFFNLILLMLSYGANIYDYDLERIYHTFGDCEFFRNLLHMDIKIRNGNRQRDIMPGLLYNIHMDIETFLSDPRNNYSLNSLKELLSYFAHPKLKSFCYSLAIENEDILAKVKNLPTVPLLVELARNKVRKFLIEKFKIENSMQFYTLIKRLPVSKVYQKIVTLETKLY